MSLKSRWTYIGVIFSREYLLTEPSPWYPSRSGSCVAQANCEVHPVLRETFCCKDGHGVGPNKNDVPELLT